MSKIEDTVISEVAQRLSGTQGRLRQTMRKYSWVPDISLVPKFREDNLKLVAASALLGAALLVLAPLASEAQTRRERPADEAPEQYPAGEHRDDTFYFCTACHGFKIVAQQGMSRDRWSETFDVMVKRHGMVDVQGEQRDQMLDYLAKAFPERRAPGGWKNPFER